MFILVLILLSSRDPRNIWWRLPGGKGLASRLLELLCPNWFLLTRFSLLLATFFAFLLLPPRDHGTSSSCWRFCPVDAFLGVPICQWIFTFLPYSLRLLVSWRTSNKSASYRSSDNQLAWNTQIKISDLEEKPRDWSLRRRAAASECSPNRNGHVSTSSFFNRCCCSTMLHS